VENRRHLRWRSERASGPTETGICRRVGHATNARKRHKPKARGGTTTKRPRDHGPRPLPFVERHVGNPRIEPDRFASEACAELRIVFPFGGEDLERHEPVEPSLPRLVNHSHAAAPHAGQEFELREKGRNLFQRGGSLPRASAPVRALSAVRLSFARHATQRPSGASAATLAPQRGHSGWIEADAVMGHRRLLSILSALLRDSPRL
jgi:hypothetical protein